jgi:hypothetical protein
VSLVDGNVSELKVLEEEEGIGEKMYARSSSPPETAIGGLGNSGWRATVNTDC